MSECMTFDENLDQKETCTEITAKDTVEFILEEVLHSAVIVSDKDCSRIGDFSTDENICQQFEQIPTYLKNFETRTLTPSQNPTESNQVISLSSGESTDLEVEKCKTTPENICVFYEECEEKIKNVGECRVISQEVLADNELQIHNGQIHLECNKPEEVNKSYLESARQEYFGKEDIIKDEKIEIGYFNEGKLNKIYVPLSNTPSSDKVDHSKSTSEGGSNIGLINQNFADYFKKVEQTSNWSFNSDVHHLGGNENCMKTSLGHFSKKKIGLMNEGGNLNNSGGWEGDKTSTKEVSAVQEFPETSPDPNRPRACSVTEEDVKKMTREIEEINFNQSQMSIEECDTSYHPDGQGDADLESKSFNSKDNFEKSPKVPRVLEEFPINRESGSFGIYTRKSSRKSVENLIETPLQPKETLDKDIKDSILKNNEKCSAITESSEDVDLKKKSNMYQNYQGDNEENPSNDTLKSKLKGSSSTTLDSDNIQDNWKMNFKVSFPNSTVGEDELGYRVELTAEECILNTQDYNHENPEQTTGIVSFSECENEEPYEKFEDDEGSKKQSTKLSITDCGHMTEYKDVDKTYTELSTYEVSFTDSIRPKPSCDLEFDVTPIDFTFTSKIDNMGIKSNTMKVSRSVNDAAATTEPSKEFDIQTKVACSLGSLKTDSFDIPGGLMNVGSISKEISNEKTFHDFGPLKYDEQNDSSLITEMKFNDSNKTDVAPEDYQDEEDKKKSSDLKYNDFSSRSFVVQQDSSESTKKIKKNSDTFHLKLERKSIYEAQEVGLKEEINVSKEMNVKNEISIADNMSITKEVDIKDETSLKEEINIEKKTNAEDGIVTTESSLSESFDESREETVEDKNPDNDQANGESSSVKSKDNEDSKEQPDDSSEPGRSNSSPPFKFLSNKLYLKGSTQNQANQGTNDLILTDSEEAFIDSTENVIQIIEPTENSADEDSNKISFYLFNEKKEDILLKEEVDEVNSKSDTNFESNEENSNSDQNDVTKSRCYSGMTTVGPMKNIDYDPKSLLLPDIDYGKMTRITSSRQLAKDIFGTGLGVNPSVKITDEDNSDEDSSTNVEGESVEVTSLVNRDIASLTKVQKVREVISYHPKPEEDFEDEENLPRPRLDLKDVESMTDERYKVPDVGIPLISFEVGNNAVEPDKDYLPNMHLVLSRNCFNESVFNEEDIEESNVDFGKSQQSISNMKMSEKSLTQKDNSKSVLTDASEKENDNFDFYPLRGRISNKDNEMQNKDVDNQDIMKIDSQDSNNPKYSTLGGVFKKASYKFIRKEGDLLLRSSKSLPKDAIKLSTTDSIKYILDDCHSSATNVLKKSRSLLKNTQSLFKTFSQGRVNTHESISKHKVTPSESDVSNADRKFSTLLRKEDFTKAKNLIKTKVEKTFKSLDGTSSPRSDSAIESDKKDLRMVVRNEDNYRVDRMENFRKLLPKSPLVYKSQFVKSQINVQIEVSENSEEKPTNKTEIIPNYTKEDSKISLVSEKTVQDETGQPPVPVQIEGIDNESDMKTSPEPKPNEGNLTWFNEEVNFEQAIQCEPEQPEFIVMETVPGLSSTDLQNSARESDFENERSVVDVEQIKSERDTKTIITQEGPIETPSSQQTVEYCDIAHEASPRLPDKNEDKAIGKTCTEKKNRTKSKKLKARFKSFWCSAFGKVKTSPKKKDPS